jgi:hypothetical protein
MLRLATSAEAREMFNGEDTAHGAWSALEAYRDVRHDVAGRTVGCKRSGDLCWSKHGSTPTYIIEIKDIKRILKSERGAQRGHPRRSRGPERPSISMTTSWTTRILKAMTNTTLLEEILEFARKIDESHCPIHVSLVADSGPEQPRASHAGHGACAVYGARAAGDTITACSNLSRRVGSRAVGSSLSYVGSWAT